MSLNVKSLENINFRHITQECGEDVARKSGNAINVIHYIPVDDLKVLLTANPHFSLVANFPPQLSDQFVSF